MDLIAVTLILWFGVLIFQAFNDDDDDFFDGGCGSPQIKVLDRRRKK